MRSDDEQVNEIEDLREQLDAANALLTECYHYQNRLPQDCVQRLRAHLAAQPATAPARDEAEPPCRGCSEGTQDRHSCQRAIIPPQTWVPPSGRPPRG